MRHTNFKAASWSVRGREQKRIGRHLTFSILAGFLLSMGAAGVFVSATAQNSTGKSDDLGAVVYVDGYGVSHIFGPTDRSVLFASAWVQAEADWPLVEENFTRSLGRAAEFLGEKALGDDYLDRALEIPRLSREEYQRASPRMRGLLDAYADGFNAWLAAHPEQKRWLQHIEPWYTLALLRFKYDQLEFLGYAGLRRSMQDSLLQRGWPIGEPSPAVSAALVSSGLGSQDSPGSSRSVLSMASLLSDSIVRYAESNRRSMGELPLGSNEWALAPSRTADGHAMLLVNPHQSFFGVQRYFEIQIHSDEGLVFSGLTRFGFLLPYMGHNRRLGWTFTDNYADIGDLYVEKFDDPAHPLAYRYGKRRRQATTWTATVRVREGDGSLGTRTFRFWKTHHGPVVGLDEAGRPLAVRLAKLAEGGWAGQLDAMIRAGRLAAFRKAVSRLDIPYMNLMYADAEGNIWYLYNSAVPRRDPSFDWSKPVDGSDPRTEWHGYHPLAELPQVLNPESGFLLNTNSAPMVATVPAPFSRSDFPPYMIGPEPDNPRSKSSRLVLEGMHQVTFDRFARAVWDTHLARADRLVPLMKEEWAAVQAARMKRGAEGALPPELEPGSRARAELAAALPRLASWNRRAGIESVETTWFELSSELWNFYGRGNPQKPGRWDHLLALSQTLQALRARWGTIEVPWGAVNRLQRPPEDDPSHFSDALPSLPVGGAAGAVFAFYPPPSRAGGRWTAGRHYGMAGNSMLEVIDFSPRPAARSVVVFGQSADPHSPHFFDQAPLYAQRMFKPAWFSLAEVKEHAVRTYRPGERAGQASQGAQSTNP